jgi:hypothetical protein
MTMRAMMMHQTACILEFRYVKAEKSLVVHNEFENEFLFLAGDRFPMALL